MNGSIAQKSEQLVFASLSLYQQQMDKFRVFLYFTSFIIFGSTNMEIVPLTKDCKTATLLDVN